MTIKTIAYHSPEYEEMLALRYRILREPWGLNFSEKDLQQEKDDVFRATASNVILQKVRLHRAFPQGRTAKPSTKSNVGRREHGHTMLRQ